MASAALRVPSSERKKPYSNKFTNELLREEFSGILPLLNEDLNPAYAFLKGVHGDWVRNTYPGFIFQSAYLFDEKAHLQADSFFMRLYEDAVHGSISLLREREFIPVFHALVCYLCFRIKDRELENLGSVFLEKGLYDEILFEIISAVSLFSGKKRVEAFYSRISGKDSDGKIFKNIKRGIFPETSGIMSFHERIALRLARGELFKTLRLCFRSSYLLPEEKTKFLLETYFNNRKYIPFLIRMQKAPQHASVRNFYQLLFILRTLSLKDREEEILAELKEKNASAEFESIESFRLSLASAETFRKLQFKMNGYAKALVRAFHSEWEGDERSVLTAGEFTEVCCITEGAGISVSNYQYCLSLAGRNLHARKCMAGHMEQQNDPRSAYMLFRKSPQSDPLIKYRTAVNAVEAGYYDEAGRIIEELLDRNADNGKLWYAYGYILEKTGREKESESAFRNASDLEEQLSIPESE